MRNTLYRSRGWELRCTRVASSQTKWHNIKINISWRQQKKIVIWINRKLLYALCFYVIMLLTHTHNPIFLSFLIRASDYLLLWNHSRNIKFDVNNFHHNDDAYFIFKKNMSLSTSLATNHSLLLYVRYIYINIFINIENLC